MINSLPKINASIYSINIPYRKAQILGGKESGKKAKIKLGNLQW